MSDILILTHVDYCPPGHLSDFLTARRLDFRVLRAVRKSLRWPGGQ